MTAHDIIIAPVITEKSNMDMAEGKYTFRVAKNASKTEVKKAVEELFNVKVVAVNTVSMPGKVKRMGVHSGKTPDWKKAIVKLNVAGDVSKNLASAIEYAEFGDVDWYYTATTENPAIPVANQRLTFLS